MNIINWFIPKKRDFYEMLNLQSSKTLEGVKFLVDYFKAPSDDLAGKISQVEQEADDLRSHLVNELNASFITPIDREDLFRLSKSVDDIIDFAKKASYEIQVYKTVPSEAMVKIAEALYKSAQEIDWAIKNLSADLLLAADHAKKAKKLENHIEYLYHAALVVLFEDKNITDVLKKREIFRHLSNTADKCDETADIIRDIAVKLS